ncbi:MAG: N-acetylmuramoyl-L-alanine amidase [Oscillospiraceae bacterium]|jgi:N-acetylmuramoyl-L-alanine amidase|nr:N-acetylmuramoyl-L-alanine amidase [Oscillospiraceae bacterium]
MKRTVKTALATLLIFSLLLSSCAPRVDVSDRSSVSEAASNGVSALESVPAPAEESGDESEPDLSGPESGLEAEERESLREEGDAGTESAASGGIADSIRPISETGDASLDLTIPAVFKITRPDKKITTTYEAYFITGTSDPSQKVFFEDEEIERLGESGLFGVLAPLQMGDNTFTFSQGDDSETVTITRKAEDQTTAVSEITQSSMFPSVQGGVKVGGAIPLRCVAPSGAEVTATFGDKTVPLTQAAQASQGIPAVFTGKLTVTGDYKADITEKIGPVSYTMTYNGKTKEYTSSGDLYIAGENSVIAIEVTSYAGFVYNTTTVAYDFKEKMKQGARDYVVWQSNDYFELSSGGYISTEMCKIIEGDVTVANTIKSPSASVRDTYEAYSFAVSSFPAYYTRIVDGVFYVTFYNTKGVPEADVSDSRLFSDVAVTARENATTYAFSLKNAGKLWGYNVSCADDALTLKFKYTPGLSTDASRPFAGITILLDPGHGGTDGGALGVPGSTGPSENIINLAHAYAIRDELKALGATVYLTRGDDSYMHLDARSRAIEEYDADLFLSVHHNSVREDKDANTISGFEMYYHTSFSKKLAESMMAGLASGVSRNNRSVNQSAYRVTLMPYAPSILMELGFMSNPREYENMTDADQISYVAQAVVDGVRRALE